MLKTYVRPSRDLRNKYSELSKIVNQHNQVIITNNGKGEAVLIGIEEYAEYEKFLHSRYVAEELAKAKVLANDQNTKWLSHNEIWEKLRAKYEI